MTRSDVGPVTMARVAIVAPLAHRRPVLVEVADAGVMEIDEPRHRDAADDEATRLLRGAPPDTTPILAIAEPDLDRLRERGEWGRITGEAELARRTATSFEHGPAAVLLGWVPEDALEALATRVAPHGGSVVCLPRPRTPAPPTLMQGHALTRSLRPLVQTYSVVPYEDVDPTIFAAVTYALMFGMMFGDVGHGLVLVGLGLLLGRASGPRFRRLRRLWPFPVAAGAAAAVFGLLYGEAFGPTGLVPTLWLSPLEDPVRLLVVGIGLGALLLGAGYVIGTVNRWREGGLRRALYAPSGLAGVALFLGGAVVAGALAGGLDALLVPGVVLAGLGLALTFAGYLAEAGSGGSAAGQAAIELVDTVIRIFANVVSFGRLAAFGLTHAAIGAVVWNATQSLWGPGAGAAIAVLVFVVGNTLAFALEGLVAGVQALRLEYYELFSRVFTGQGRLFRPWHVAVANEPPVPGSPMPEPERRHPEVTEDQR